MKSERPWREIAEEVSKEHDSGKVAALSDEVIQALDKQTRESEQTQKSDQQEVHGKSA
jgi:hypothetical protein